MPTDTNEQRERAVLGELAPTCGPTNSTRRISRRRPVLPQRSITFCESCARLVLLEGMRISTSREEPKFCTSAL